MRATEDFTATSWFEGSAAACHGALGAQAVMKVPSPAGRAAYLQKAFKSDWEGAAPVRSAPGTVRWAGRAAEQCGGSAAALCVPSRSPWLRLPGSSLRRLSIGRLPSVRRPPLRSGKLEGWTRHLSP